MSVSDDVPYFSRFLVKFIEICAAGLATAVSGYMIAHLAGALSSSTPAPVGTAIQVAPSASTVPSGPPVPLTPPVSADVNEQHAAPQQEADAPAVAQPAHGTEPAHAPEAAHASETAHATEPVHGTESAHGTVNTTRAVAARKHPDTDASTAASAAESKRDQASVLARIRAALANSNAKRTSPPDITQRQGNVPLGPATIGARSPPANDRLGVAPGAVAPGVAPGGASVTAAPPDSAKPLPPPVQQSVQQSATEPSPLTTTIEIQSRPVATDQTAPAPASQEETGVLSTLDRLRHDPLAATDDAPRPPMPVGQ